MTVDGHDHIRDYRAARAMIGLVPQELTTDAFETVWATCTFSRGLFGKPHNPAFIEKVLKDVSLWDKKDQKIMTLSGGMKRRVLIAKALSHEPQILFLDEPTAGVDVELRKDMWEVVRALRASGVTIILTTHYIEEAELMADRVGVINKGEMILVEDKAALMHKLGKKQLKLELQQKLDAVPPELAVLQPHACRRRPRADLHLRGAGRAARHHPAGRESVSAEHPAEGHQHHAKLARGHLRRSGEEGRMNWRAVWAIYRFEMARTGRTLFQSIVSPVISTSLYFVVFGAAIGSRIPEIEGVSYGSFIVPGLIMMMLLDAERDERLVRHLFPAVRRHDLRDPVGAGVGLRDRAGLCRRRRHQVDRARASSSSPPPGCSCRCGSRIRSG